MRARNWDVAAALQMWTQMLTWRQQHGADDILTQFDFVERPAFLNVYTTGLHKTDRQGRPILIQQLGRVDLTAISTITTDERMCLWHIQEYEKLFRVIFPACSQHQGVHIDQLFVVVDLQGVSFTDMIRVRKLLTMFMKMDSDNYPETLAVMAIINAPYWFGRMWSAIKEFLQGDTVKKIQILSSDYQTFLLQHIAPENLLACYGGTSQGPITHNLGPWDDPSPHTHTMQQQHASETRNASNPPHQSALPAVTPAAISATSPFSAASQRPTHQQNSAHSDSHREPEDGAMGRQSSHPSQKSHTSHVSLLPHALHHPLLSRSPPSTLSPHTTDGFGRRYHHSGAVDNTEPLLCSPLQLHQQRQQQQQQQQTGSLHIRGSSPRSKHANSNANSPPSPSKHQLSGSPTDPHPAASSPHTAHSVLSLSSSTSTSAADPAGCPSSLRVSIASTHSDEPFFSPCSTNSRSVSGMGSPSSTTRSLFFSSPYSHGQGSTTSASQHALQQAHPRSQPTVVPTTDKVSALTTSLSTPTPAPRIAHPKPAYNRTSSAAHGQRLSPDRPSPRPPMSKLTTAASTPHSHSTEHDVLGTSFLGSDDSTRQHQHAAGGLPSCAAQSACQGGVGVLLSSRYEASVAGSVAGSIGFWSAASSPNQSRRTSMELNSRGSGLVGQQQRGFHLAVVAAGHALANGSVACGVAAVDNSQSLTVITQQPHPQLVSSHVETPRFALAPLLTGSHKHKRGPASMGADDAIAAAEAACAAADALHYPSPHHPHSSAPHNASPGRANNLAQGSRPASMGDRKPSFSNLLLASPAEHGPQPLVSEPSLADDPHSPHVKHEHASVPQSSTRPSHSHTIPPASHHHSRSDSVTQRPTQGSRQAIEPQQEFLDHDTDQSGEDDDESNLLTPELPHLPAATSTVRPWYLMLPGASWFRHRVQSSRHRRVDKRVDAAVKQHHSRGGDDSGGAAQPEGSSNGDSGGERGPQRCHDKGPTGGSEDITRCLLPPSGPSVSGMRYGHCEERAANMAEMVGMSGLQGSSGSGRIAVEAVADLVTGLVAGAGEAFKTHAKAAGRRVRQSRARRRRQQEKQRGPGTSLNTLSSLCCGGSLCVIM
ncbi:MAG: hypothetical protein WDW38_008169 [Sanguina aurantia]